ncbi:uncharacterized protein LOC117759341 [Hippoglossus hippoglossus]|uniref:uncharacterized protein LOC117759341 n=1 Tax=Hippoglossus hippoglossus TaxID=8267 RepID=UPI00148D382D|nr:uncharacterized protein LOC117759341 [Hippoglossus hippoglossus]
MEASPCAQIVTSHTASLLMSLNLQRQRAQFCDCVVRQRQSPGQLYPAHRCVLAASSPVLSSILSSSGALVELQAPCLTGSVLALLLDYIYTGNLPFSRIQQYYYSLLTSACYLQMDELQEALRAWQKTKASGADKTNVSTGNESELCRNVICTATTNSCSKHLPSTCSVDALPRQEETGGPLERVDHPYSCDEVQMHSTSLDSCIKSTKTDISGINGTNGCSSSCILSNCSSISEDYSDGVNTGKCTPLTYLTPQDFIQNIPDSAEEHIVSEVDKEVQKDQFHSAGTETWQTSTEEELERKVEDKRKLSSPSSSSPHPYCEAVPVIRHSSTADMHQLAEVPPYHSISKASVDSSRAAATRLASKDIDDIAEGVTTKHKNHHGEQDQDDRICEYVTGTQSLDYKNSSDHCTEQDICYRSSRDQSDTLEQQYSSNGDYFMKQNDEHVDNGLSHNTDHNNHHAHCDSFQSKDHTKYLGDDSVPQNKICGKFIRGLKHKAELSFDDLPSKHQQLDWSDGPNVSTSAAAEETLSQDLRDAAPLPEEMSDTGSGSQGDANDKQSYSSRGPAKMDRQEPHCNLYESRKDWFPTLHRAQTSTYDTVSAQQENESVRERRATAALDNVTGRLFDFERRTSLELSEITEPRLTFTKPGDSNMSDLMCSVVGQSYHGHLHYHCLRHEDTRLLYRDSDHKPSHPDYSNQSSDEEEEEANTGRRSLRPHFATETTDQVLLLDISAKPAELLVAYKHKSDDIAFCKNDIFGSGVREQQDEATSVAGVEKKKSRTAARLGAKSFDECKNESWVGKTNLERPGDGAIQKAVSNPEEGKSQSGILAACSSSCIPDCVQASISSTLSVCIPATLSASMPRNISAHLSTPLHQPFQCSLCDRSFSQRGSLNRHVRSHLGVRPFPCPCCPMTFSRQYRVTEHMRVHQRFTHGNDFHKTSASSI